MAKYLLSLYRLMCNSNDETCKKRLIGRESKCTILFLLIICTMVITICIQHIENNYVATDELCHLLGGYKDRLQTEGRWINFLLFPALKLLNPHVALFAGMLFWGHFAYTCASNISDKWSAYIICLCALLAPSLTMQLDWPCTMLPALIICSFAACIYQHLNKFSFFILFGVLCAGVVQSVYMVLPLLFLNQSKRELLKVILLWILGYLFGFAVANLATYAICGSFITFADWRSPQHVTSWSILIDNYKRVIFSYSEHMGRASLLLHGICLVAASFVIWENKKNWRKAILILLLLLMVIMSTYAQAITASFSVATRTVLNLHMGILFAVLFAFRNKRSLQFLFLGAIAYVYFTYSSEMLKFNNLRKTEWCNDFQNLHITPYDVSRIVLLSDANDFDKTNASYRAHGVFVPPMLDGSPLYYWSVAPFSCGLYNVISKEKGLLLLQDLNIKPEELNFKRQGSLTYAIAHDILIVKINTLPSHKI